MAEKEHADSQVGWTAFAIVACAAVIAFVIILLINGDWIPATITIAAMLIGLAVQIPNIRNPRSEGGSPPSSAGSV